MASRNAGEERQELKLSEASQTLLDECRMVLPGIQALFGFQLIAVFNTRFESLSGFDQRLHLAAILLVALAVTMVMTPAAYHRSHGAREVTSTFIHVSSVLLIAGMVPLAAALSMDFYVIVKLVLGEQGPALGLAAGLFAFMAFCWFVFPRLGGFHRGIARFRELSSRT
jgi:hypothetical protein